MVGKEKTIKQFFSVYVGLIPIIQYYRSPIRSLNTATFFALLFTVVFCFLLFANRFVKIEKKLWPFRLYTFFIISSFIVTSFIYHYSFNWENIAPVFRFIVLTFSLVLFGHKYFDAKHAYNTIEVTLLASTLFILLQNVAYYIFGFGFKPFIVQLLTVPDYARVNGRFSGFFMEPSHFAQVAILYLTMSIFQQDTQMDRAHITKVFIIVFGVVLSGSGQGYFLLSLLLVIWIVYQTFRRKLSSKRLIVTIAVLFVSIIGLVLFSRLNLVQIAMARILGSNGSIGGEALLGRTFTNVFFSQLSKQNKIFGIGFGHLQEITKTYYVNSLYSHLIQCGYFSIVVLANLLLFSFIYGKVSAKVFVLLYAITIYFASTASPTDLCFYYLFIYSQFNGISGKRRRIRICRQ